MNNLLLDRYQDFPFSLLSIECYNVEMKCGMGEGFSFNDFKVGTTFYISPNKIRYVFGISNVSSEKELEFLQGTLATDKYKVISKYERTLNLNPYVKKKYHLFINFWAMNLRLKRKFRFERTDCEFCYVDCL